MYLVVQVTLSKVTYSVQIRLKLYRNVNEQMMSLIDKNYNSIKTKCSPLLNWPFGRNNMIPILQNQFKKFHSF